MNEFQDVAEAFVDVLITCLLSTVCVRRFPLTLLNTCILTLCRRNERAVDTGAAGVMALIRDHVGDGQLL